MAREISGRKRGLGAAGYSKAWAGLMKVNGESEEPIPGLMITQSEKVVLSIKAKDNTYCW